MFVHILSNVTKSNDFTISMDVALLARHLQSVVFKSAMNQNFYIMSIKQLHKASSSAT